MTRVEYTRHAAKLYDEGKINADVYDAIIMNADVFCDDDDMDERLPAAYAEIEYDDFDTPEAVIGTRFDDMNYLRYMER